MTLRSTLIAALTLLALPSAAAHAAVPPGTDFTEEYFPSGDGTQLHADVIRPKGAGKTPVILAIGPYFAHGGSQGAVDYDPTREAPNERFKDLWTEGRIFERGYTMVQVDLRGFGASEGCNDFGGPGEQADVKAAVEWAASQPWSTGKVGMWGKSYDGWTQVMGLATKPQGLAAAVIQSPIIDGYRALYMNGVHYDAGWYATPGLYQNIDATPPTIFDNPAYVQGVAKGTDPACYAQNIAEQNATMDKSDPFWQARDLVPRAKGTEVPTLWSHGFLDANTKPDNFMDVFGQQSGPRRAWFGQYTHVRPQDKRSDDETMSTTGRQGFIDEAMRWMDRYVKGDASSAVESDPAVEVEDGALQRYRAEAAWPPSDGQQHALTLNAGTHTDRPGNDGRPGPGNGIWSISAPLAHDVHLAGVPRVTLDVETSATNVNLYGIVYDIDDRRRAMLVSRGAFRVDASGKAAFDLYPQDWTFKAGHRLGFLVAQADDEWFNPPPSNATVEVKGGTLSAPFLQFTRSSFLPSRPSEDEENLPPGFQLDLETVEEGAAAFDTPPALREPSSVVLPVTEAGRGGAGGSGGAAGSRFDPRLSVRLRRLKRNRWLVTGRAPAGYPPLIRLERRKAGAKRFRTVGWRRPAVNKGSFRRTFKAKLPGRYRAVATLRAAGVPVKATSRVLRKR